MENYVQLSRSVLFNMRQLVKENQIALNILLLLVDKMNKQNAIIISMRALEEMTGYKRTTLSLAIKVLKDEQWVQVIKIGSANAYFINSKAFWGTSTNKKVYAHFTAEVITTATEQKQSIDYLANQQLKQAPSIGKDDTVLIGDDELPPPDQLDLEV